MRSWKQQQMINAKTENKEKRRFTNSPYKSLDSTEVYTFVFFLYS